MLFDHPAPITFTSSANSADPSAMASASLNLNIAQFFPPGVDTDRVRQTLYSSSELQILEEGMYTDITLQAQGGSVRTHRQWLASLSPVLSATFHTNMREQQLMAIPEITIEGLELLLVLLYGVNNQTVMLQVFRGAVDKHFSEILEACRKYHIIKLVPTLNQALLGNLTRENCWNWYRKSIDINTFFVKNNSGVMEGYCLLPSLCLNYIMENCVEMEKMRIE